MNVLVNLRGKYGTIRGANPLFKRETDILEQMAASLTNATKGTRAMADIDSTPKKSCYQCGNEHPWTLEYFAKHSEKNGKIYLRGICHECNRAQKAEATRRRYHADPQRVRDYKKTRRMKNPELFSIRGREAYYKHHDRMLATTKRYRQNNPDKIRASNALRKNAIGVFTADDVTTIYNSQKGLCWWCDNPVGEKYHVDHRIALAKGGTNWPNNLCISCPECNLKKSDKMPWQFNGRLV